jgi:phosphopantothenoylcysteine synthetase/decarboxylase
MRLLITFGPAWEPLDGARRLTNMSTGRLGTLLANAFLAAGWEVQCLRGEGSTYSGPLFAHEVETFTTNLDLAQRLERISGQRRVDAVFHAAALCDYRVARITDSSGRELQSEKLSTEDGGLVIQLDPAAKVLPQLRGWFPQARIVGWKYELAGSRDQAFARAWRQVQACASDACVLNGAAYGTGFAVCGSEGSVETCLEVAQLAECLRRRMTRSDGPRQESRRTSHPVPLVGG